MTAELEIGETLEAAFPCDPRGRSEEHTTAGKDPGVMGEWSAKWSAKWSEEPLRGDVPSPADAPERDSDRSPAIGAEIDRPLVDRIRREFFARCAASPPPGPEGARPGLALSTASERLSDATTTRRRVWFGEPRHAPESPALATSAVRYGVLIDDLLAHLRGANLAATPGPARVLSFLDDLVLATACVRGHPQAWQDAWQRHESVLLRAARMRLGESDAVVFTRRFWIDLHAATVDPTVRRFGDPLAAIPSIDRYVGVRPLRVWLTDRLMGRIENETRRRGRGALQLADHLRAAFASGRIVSLADRSGGDRSSLRAPLERRLRLVD